MAGRQAKTMHGARAVMKIDGEPVGIWMDVSWSALHDVRPVDILGRFTSAELVTVGVQPVAISCTGWRPVEQGQGAENARGPHVDAKVPKVQDLLSIHDVDISVWDRQTDRNILVANNCRPAGYRTRVSVRGLQEISVDYIGIIAYDESGPQMEGEGAADYLGEEN